MKSKNIILLSFLVGVALTGIFFYRRKKEKDLSSALEEYIDKSYTETNLSKGGDEAIEDIKKLKIDTSKLAIGKLYGKYSNPEIRDEISKIVVGLHDSMDGMGTDLNKFSENFFKIKNKNTLAFINSVYTALYKIGLFERMKQELKLNSSSFAKFNDKSDLLQGIPFIGENWNPAISLYIQKLPEF